LEKTDGVPHLVLTLIEGKHIGTILRDRCQSNIRAAKQIKPLLLFFRPLYLVRRVDKKLSIQEKKAGMVPNPAGPQQKNCRAARQS